MPCSVHGILHAFWSSLKQNMFFFIVVCGLPVHKSTCIHSLFQWFIVITKNKLARKGSPVNNIWLIEKKAFLLAGKHNFFKSFRSLQACEWEKGARAPLGCSRVSRKERPGCEASSAAPGFSRDLRGVCLSGVRTSGPHGPSVTPRPAAGGHCASGKCAERPRQVRPTSGIPSRGSRV